MPYHDVMLYPLDPQQMRVKAEAGEPLNEQLFQGLKEKIERQVYRPGCRLASVRKLADSLQISRDTVLRTYDRLISIGLIESRPGAGFYVCNDNVAQRSLKSSKGFVETANNDGWRTLLSSELPFNSKPGCGLLPPAWIADNEIAVAMRYAIKNSVKELSHYAPTLGYLPLRQQLHMRMSSYGVNIALSQIITTQGGIAAVGLVTQAMFHSGSYIAIASPSSFMIRQQLLSRGMELLSVPYKNEQLDLAVLEQHCQQFNVRAFYCSSILNNPNSVNLSANQAFELLRLANQYDFYIIDDLSYMDLQPVGNASLLQLHAMDQFRRVVAIGSFSKTLSPALAVGYILASTELVTRFGLYKAAQSIHSPIINEIAVHQLLATREYHRICNRLVSRVAEQSQKSLTKLSRAGLTCHGHSAGIYQWCSLGDSVDSWVVQQDLQKRGYVVAAGKFFSDVKSDESFMRFNLAVEYSDAFIEVLAEYIR